MPDVQRELAKALHLAGSSPDQHMELLLALTPVVQDLMRRATAAELAEIVAEAERIGETQVPLWHLRNVAAALDREGG